MSWLKTRFIHVRTLSCHFVGLKLTRIKLFLVARHQHEVAASSSSYLSENVVSLRLLDPDEAGVDVVIRTQLQTDPAVVNWDRKNKKQLFRRCENASEGKNKKSWL